MVLFALICGYLPFCDPETPKLYKKILSGCFKFPAGISEQAKDLIERILQVNPSKRATLEDIKRHPWFEMIESQKIYGIDIRHYKVPTDPKILSHLRSMGYRKATIEEDIELNKKNK